MMDGLAVGLTLRNWAVPLHMDPIYDMTSLGLVPQSVRVLGPVGRGGPVEHRAGGTAHSAS